jgi:acetate kinase
MTPIRVLAVNVGSSSLRLDLWEIPGKSPQVVLEAGGIGGSQTTVSVGGRAEGSAALADHAAALDALLARLPPPLRLDRVGHRVVHGGPRYREPVWVDDRVLEDLDGLAGLVPLHNPPAVRAIRHLMQALPRIPQAAVFDTAFHASLPPHAVEYAVPLSWRAKGIRRYGFHGLACADAVSQLGPRLRERAVLLHLGAGCSATALLRGRSADTTMGLTPLEGLVMGTRSGDLDPGIVPYLQREHHLSIEQIDQALNHACGLLGLSALSGDMRTLLDQVETPAVRGAIDVFCYRAAKAVGSLSVALGGCDQIIFTGGIGEHAPPIRKWIIGRLEFLGAHLDEEANSASAAVISDPRSAISIHVVRIDEGRQIALETARLATSE